jgi:type III restriction enzyme
MEIPRTHLSVNRGRVQVVTEQQTDQFTALQTGRPEHLEIAAPTQTSTDVVKLIAHMLHHSTPPVRVGWKTLAQLVKRTTNRRAAQESPQAFASRVVDLIRTEFSKLLIDGIQYEKTGEEYELTRFESEIQSWEEFLAKAEHCLYDHVVYHSEVERQFVIDLEKWDAVKLYVKLPSWFVVPTPIGNYTPDWAIVIEPRDSHGERTGEQYTYLVSETKSTRDLSKLRPDEVRKIKCGEAHFTRALGVVYKHVVKVQELQKG